MMKKLKLDLDGIGELLSKEQMKMVTGGDSYSYGMVTCHFKFYAKTSYATECEVLGYSQISMPINYGTDDLYMLNINYFACADFCDTKLIWQAQYDIANTLAVLPGCIDTVYFDPIEGCSVQGIY